MACDFIVTDCFGKEVRLDHSNWEKHAARRPEAVPYHDRLPEVLRSPHLVIKAYRDGHFHFYRLGVTEGRFRNHYLKVVVEYAGDGRSGVVKTWWLPTEVDAEGSIEWVNMTTHN
jgi:hypothetical protein